jgi:DNA repair exonuclease SbcCD nuclease subunit
MNYLFYTDLHITDDSLKECESILDEILILCEQYKIHTVYNLGDTFDSIKPSSAALDLFSNFIKKLNRPMVLLVANSHESETQTISIVNHFGILTDKINVVKEYKDEEKLYLGHFIVNESKTNLFGGTKSKTELSGYKNVILGHGHNFEIIKPNICQLGSCRYVSFGEDANIKKRIGLVTDYGEEKERWGFIELKSPYPIVNIEVSSILDEKASKTNISAPISDKTDDTTIDTKKQKSLKNAPQKPLICYEIKELCEILDKLAPATKVRTIFKEYDLWRAFLPFYQKYKGKFNIFRDKKDFIIEDKTVAAEKSETQTVVESLKKYLEDNKIDPKIRDILLEELK